MGRIGLVLVLVACGAETPAPAPVAAKKAAPPLPAAQQVHDLIAGSAELGEHQFTNAGWTAPVDPSLMSAPIRAEARQLADAGWISLGKEVAVTDKSASDKRFLMRANGLLDIVPLAKKEMGDVGAMRPNADGTIAVDFDWRWVPNEVGSAFRTGAVHDRFAAAQKSTATLIWDGTSWTVLKID